MGSSAIRYTFILIIFTTCYFWLLFILIFPWSCGIPLSFLFVLSLIFLRLLSQQCIILFKIFCSKIIFKCVCICVCVCVLCICVPWLCVPAILHQHLCDPIMMVRNPHWMISSNYSPPYFVRHDISWNLETIDSPTLVSQ